MRYRSTILYFFAALILAGIYLYDIRQDKERGKAQETARLLFSISANQLESIILKKRTESVVLQRIGNSSEKIWKITAPIHSSTENLAIEELKNKLVNLKYTRIIAKSPGDLTQFGLDPPSFTVIFRAGAESGKLSFGSKSPIEDGFYATRGEETKVYLISIGDKGILDKDIFELRNKRLFTLDPSKVKLFIINRDTERWSLIKRAGRWVFEDAEEFKIEEKRVASLLNSFVYAKASSFEEESVKDLKPFGLHRPRARIILSDGERSQELLLGIAIKENNTKIYAKMGTRPQVISVNKWLWDTLPQNKEAIIEERKSRE